MQPLQRGLRACHSFVPATSLSCHAHLPVSPLLPLLLQDSGGLNASGLAANEYLSDLARFKTPHVLEARARGAKCFDFDHYASHNPDLSPIAANQLALWRHFVYYGQFESRPFRWGRVQQGRGQQGGRAHAVFDLWRRCGVRIHSPGTPPVGVGKLGPIAA
jgi:hypothetical protein